MSVSKAAPCRTIPDNPDTVAFGTIVHYCWRRDDAEPEDRCGTVCMVIGLNKIGHQLYDAVELQTLSAKRAGALGRIVSMSLTLNSPHHIADNQGEQA